MNRGGKGKKMVEEWLRNSMQSFPKIKTKKKERDEGKAENSNIVAGGKIGKSCFNREE